MKSKILNVARLNAKLERLPKVTMDEIRTALARQADKITDTMRQLVPVEQGDLKASIGWTFGKAPRGALTFERLITSALGGQLTITIYAGNDEAFYARWVEFGTQPHALGSRSDISRGKQSGRVHPGAQARPFFFPAYRANRKGAKASVRRAVTKAAKRVVLSNGRNA